MEELECFTEVRVVMGLQLSPMFIGSMANGVELHILQRLMKYDAALGGVPIACPRYKICSSAAFIPTDYSVINCNVDATFIVFSPVAGQMLMGVVNQTSADHVGLLIHGTFNASIAAADLKENYVYDEAESDWKDDDGEVVLTDDTPVRFEVTGFEMVDHLFAVRGSIKPAKAGPLAGAVRQAPDASKLNASARRRQRRNVVEKRDRHDDDAEPEAEAPPSEARKAKKRKQVKTEQSTD